MKSLSFCFRNQGRPRSNPRKPVPRSAFATQKLVSLGLRARGQRFGQGGAQGRPDDFLPGAGSPSANIPQYQPRRHRDHMRWSLCVLFSQSFPERLRSQGLHCQAGGVRLRMRQERIDHFKAHSPKEVSLSRVIILATEHCALWSHAPGFALPLISSPGRRDRSLLIT